MKKALITGVTGQDGAYMSRLLLEKGYEVHGLKRRSSLFNTARIDDLYQDPQNSDRRYFLHYGDLTDGSSLNKLIYDIQPDEIYHLGAMSHVKVSFDMPEYTSNVIGQGTLRLLESIRLLGLDKKTRIINAASSEMYGNTPHIPQHERTPHYPQSPYAASKLFAYWMAINYRESYNMYCANAIMFNHESPLRGETFVTRKITMAVARIALGLQDLLYLGNLDSKRDWGHSEDYMRAMWLILQQEQPDDFVIATGRSYSVREMLITAFENIGVQLRFEGSGVGEKAFVVSSTDPRYPMTQGKQVMAIDPRYFRPSEVHNLCGDATKAKQELGWEPHYTFQSLISEMVAADIELFSAGQNLPSKNYNRL